MTTARSASLSVMTTRGLEDNAARPPTMTDVARRAGVSATTVSFVVNDRRDQTISEATRARVLAAVEELGYRPNRAAQGLKNRRTDTLGFINHERPGEPLAGPLLSGAHDAAWEWGAALVVVNTDHEGTRLRNAADELLDRRVDGIIVAAVGTRPVTVPTLLRGTAALLVNMLPTDDDVPVLLPDEYHGGQAAARMLLEAGHTRIALLSGIETSWATQERLRGHLDALREAGVDPAQQFHAYGGFDAASGHALTRSLVRTGEVPTAIVCGNDRMALGALLALAEVGLRVPQDVSLVGYDDQPLLASEMQPPLSTVELPYYAMGRWAADHLLSGAVPTLPARTYLPCRAVPRASVRDLRNH